MVDILIIFLSLAGAIASILALDVVINNNYDLPHNLFEDEEEL